MSAATGERVNLLNKFINAAFWFAGTTYFFSAINFFGQIVLAHILLPAQFGVYAFLFAVRELVAIFINFSSTQSFIYSDGKQSDFDACYYLNIIALSFYFLIGLIGALILNMYYSAMKAEFFLILCLAQGISLLASVYLAPIEKDLNYKRSSLIRAFGSLGGLIIGIGMAYLTRDTLSLALKEFFQALFLFGLAWTVAPMRFKFSAVKVDFLTQLSFGMKSLISRGFEVIYYSAQDIVINFLFGKPALGNFYQARYLSNMPLRLSLPFTQQVLFSFLTNFKTDSQKLAQYLFWVNYILVRAMLPVAVLIMWLGEPIFTLIYGEHWAEAGKYFQYFSVYLLFCPLFEAQVVACFSLKKQEISVIAYILALIASVSGMLIVQKPIFTALFFSLGFAVGSFYIFAALRRQQVHFALTQLLLKPLLCFLVMWMAKLYALSFVQMSALFLLCITTLCFLERQQLNQLFKRLLLFRLDKDA